MVFGLPLNVAHGVFTTCVEQIEAHEVFADRQVRGDVLNGYDVALLALEQSLYPEYPGSAMGFYEDADFSSLQLIWPDRRNHFLWKPEADPSFTGDQIILSTTAA